MRILTAGLIAILSFAAHAAVTDLTVTSGTCALTVREYDAFSRNSRVIALRFAWTSSTDGDVVVATQSFHGKILRVVTNPGATAPTDNYDITAKDEDGLDVLAGGGANRDTTNSEHFAPFLSTNLGTDSFGFAQPVIAGPLTIAISTAGSEKNGELIIYLERT